MCSSDLAIQLSALLLPSPSLIYSTLLPVRVPLYPFGPPLSGHQNSLTPYPTSQSVLAYSITLLLVYSTYAQISILPLRPAIYGALRDLSSRLNCLDSSVTVHITKLCTSLSTPLLCICVTMQPTICCSPALLLYLLLYYMHIYSLYYPNVYSTPAQKSLWVWVWVCACQPAHRPPPLLASVAARLLAAGMIFLFLAPAAISDHHVTILASPPSHLVSPPPWPSQPG